ncbi:WHG domain-containing protein [Bacillaceae bacterium Marseille-Q3522]|nr:WHG domain-containing protein [Bacillaceae bacterium Marseille-Q3522]
MSPRPGLDKKAILQAATEIADEKGMPAVTLATLAKKLQIRPPSLYNHVDGLPGLQRALAIYGLERMYEMLTKEAAGRAKDAAVHAISNAYLDFARSHPGLYEAILWMPGDAKDEEFRQIAKKTVDLLTFVLRGYDLDEVASIHAVRGLRSILHGFTSLDQKRGFAMPFDRDLSLCLIIDAFLAGINKMKEYKPEHPIQYWSDEH